MSDDVNNVPRMVADKLARKCWSVSRDDLRQEAEAAALHARKNYDPEKGDLRGYLWRSVARHLTNYMWEQGSPVTYKHRRNELRATSAVLVEKAHHIADPINVVENVQYALWRVRVMERASELAGADAELIAPCLFEKQTPLAVAKARCVPLLRVLEAVGKVRAAISEDTEMRQLWEDAP